MHLLAYSGGDDHCGGGGGVDCCGGGLAVSGDGCGERDCGGRANLHGPSGC